MARPDESITYLKDRGYCVIRTPRSGVQPLNTLLKAGKKDLTRLGQLANITVPGANPLPKLSVDNVAPGEINGRESSSTKLEIGLNILGGIIGALGGNKLALTAGYNKAKSMTFTFAGVMEDHINLDLLDSYLSTSSIKPDQKAVTDALIDDEVYVITSSIKTTKFTVNAQGEGGVKVGLEVPVIKEVASGSLSVDVTKAVEGTVTYEGTTPVVFGFQAVRLFYDQNGVYTTVDPLDAGKMGARAVGKMGARAVRNIQPTLLELDQGAFFRLADAEDQAAGAGR